MKPAMRILISASVSLLILLAGTVYTLRQPELYEAKGILEKLEVEKESDGWELGQPSMEEAIQTLKSEHIAQEVAGRLLNKKPNNLVKESAGNDGWPDDAIELGQYLYESDRKSFRIVPESQTIEVVYRHEVPEIAALVVNDYLREFIDHGLKVNIDASMKQVEAERIRYSNVEETIGKLREEISVLASQDVKGPESLRKLSELRRKLSEATEISQKLKKALTTEIVRGNLRNHAFRILKEADTPSQPASPNIPLSFTMSFFAAFLGGTLSFIVIGRIKQSAV